MRISLKKLLFIGITVGVLGSVGAWFFMKPPELPKTVRPERRDIAKVLEVSGAIDAHERADLHFIAMSKLTWVGVKEGDTVKKWQTLAAVDTRTLQKQLQQNLNLFEKAVRSNDQQGDDLRVYDPSGLSLEEKRIAEKSQFDLRNAALQVEIQDIAIKQSSLVSPIEGVVTRIDKPLAGENVTSADVFQVVNPKTLYFGAIIDEVDIGTTAAGQQAVITLDAYPDNSIQTVVKKIDFVPSVSKNGGTGYKAYLDLHQSDQNTSFRLGMNGTAAITLQSKSNALTVPTDSIISKNGTYYVDVLDQKKVVAKEIKIGLETEVFTEILEGINEQTDVVIPDSAEN